MPVESAPLPLFPHRFGQNEQHRSGTLSPRRPPKDIRQIEQERILDAFSVSIKAFFDSPKSVKPYSTARAAKCT